MSGSSWIEHVRLEGSDRGRGGLYRCDRRHERRAAACAAAAKVAECGERARVGPVEIVDQQDERRVLGDESDKRLEHLDLVERRLGTSERQLGKDLSQRR